MIQLLFFIIMEINSRRELFSYVSGALWLLKSCNKKAEHCQRIALKIQSINNILVKTMNKELLANIKSKPLRDIKNMAQKIHHLCKFDKVQSWREELIRQWRVVQVNDV